MTELDTQIRKFQKELSAGTVALVLLAELSRATEPRYARATMLLGI